MKDPNNSGKDDEDIKYAPLGESGRSSKEEELERDREWHEREGNKEYQEWQDRLEQEKANKDDDD